MKVKRASPEPMASDASLEEASAVVPVSTALVGTSTRTFSFRTISRPTRSPPFTSSCCHKSGSFDHYYRPRSAHLAGCALGVLPHATSCWK